MDDYMDDLSEDWISQPADSPAASINFGTSKGSQSRIPRPKSIGSSGATNSRDGSTRILPGRRKSVLTERSANQDNINATPLSQKGTQHVRTFSGLSAQSLAFDGTVAIKPERNSPSKPNRPEDTPEWKRRLVHGQLGYGEQKDLFSPIGLQNIFQQPAPTSSAKPEVKRRGLLSFSGLDAMPSSPPPWPAAREPSRTVLQDNNATNLDPLDEEDEEISPEASPSSAHSFSSVIRNEEDDLVPPLKPSRDTALHYASAKSSRTDSGQTELRDEEFSAVYISKHTTADGRVDYAALDMPRSKIAEQIEQLRLRSGATQSSRKVTQTSNAPTESALDVDEGSTLPDDLPHGTPDSMHMGSLNAKRGGYSISESVRRHPVSPSPLSRDSSEPDGAEMSILEEPEVLYQPKRSRNHGSSDLPSEAPQPPPHAPQTPSRDRQNNLLSPDVVRSRPSGSPLKLFDNHDTFTSNRLLRRMSQLEDIPTDLKDELSSIKEKREPSTRRNTGSRLSSVGEEQKSQLEASYDSRVKTPGGRQVSFGEGELDQYLFPEDISIATPSRANNSEDERDGSPSPNAAPPGFLPTFKFRVNSVSEQDDGSFRSKRKISKVSSAVSSLPRGSIKSKKPVKPVAPSPKKLYVDSPAQDEDRAYTEGKRPPTSPFKNPTPKRRRTLLTLDVKEDLDSGSIAVYETHNRMQSILASQRIAGRKRLSSRQISRSYADPDTLARRQILRPRNPTPASRRQEVEDEILDVTEAFMTSSPHLEAIKEHLAESAGPGEDAKAKVVAEEVADFSMKMASAMRSDQRKKSITTQDFLNEAMLIMNFLRNKKRPSQLGSVVESGLETPYEEAEEDEYQEGEYDEDEYHMPSDLTFDRPPSREGATSGWRDRNKVIHDARVVSQLRRYEDRTDEDFILSSMRSLRINERITTPTHAKGDSWTSRKDFQPDSPSRERKIDGEGDPDSIKTIPTHTSNPSIDSSVGRTIASTVSRTSQNVATLAPDAVAHLIPNEIAGMAFDKEKGVWVRSKSRSPTKGARSPGAISSITQSDEDPFAAIPDLTVDEQEELARISPSRKPTAEFKEERPVVHAPIEQLDLKKSQSRPRTRDGSGIPPADTSSAPSKWSHFASSEAQIETRATSWSDQEAAAQSRKLSAQAVRDAMSKIPEADEVEHEIQINEGRTRGRDPKPVRISISRSIPKPLPPSPPGQQKMQEPEHRDDTEELDLADSADEDLDGPSQISSQSSTPRLHTPGAKNRYGYRGAARRSIVKSRGQEQSLVATNPRSRTQNFSLSVVRTQNGEAILAEPTSPCARADVTFLLSDLPDFTVNQIDEREIPERAVVKSNLHAAGCYREDRFESGNDALVKALQDFAPEEPYWEDLRKVDVHGKGLTSLHLLDTLCYRVEKLNVADNAISQLAGVPSCVRQLDASQNTLSSLTFWGHLIHLQYMDVSSNAIDSLEGLECLIHLRELRADDNQITSLDGVLHLDGLLKLSLKGNNIETADFDGAELKRLTHLDLSANKLASVHNLQCLPSLTHLDLSNDELSSFGEDVFNPSVVTRSTWNGHKKLYTLRLKNNSLSSLNLTHFPNLEYLDIDTNRLSSISGLSFCTRLRTLSARSQSLSSPTDYQSLLTSIFINADIHTLFLSQNALPTLSLPPTSLLNLCTLELASTGLTTLPDEFGQLCPNLRYLNLNFNALKDLRPLLNVKRLESLHVAGNRLARLRKPAAVLAMLGSLKQLDLRDNPISIGFYGPITENRLTLRWGKPKLNQQDAEDDSDSDEGDGEHGRFELPPADPDADAKYKDRLDEDTMLRRRVYEMLLANSCKGLAVLDGLRFGRKKVLVKDAVWERLVQLGILRKSAKDMTIADGSVGGLE